MASGKEQSLVQPSGNVASDVAGRREDLRIIPRRIWMTGMEDALPSRTALRVARLRALHQFSPQAALFRDPYAAAILGETAPGAQELEQEDERGRRMRLFVAARARLAEDWLAAAVRRGVR